VQREVGHLHLRGQLGGHRVELLGRRLEHRLPRAEHDVLQRLAHLRQARLLGTRQRSVHRLEHHRDRLRELLLAALQHRLELGQRLLERGQLQRLVDVDHPAAGGERGVGGGHHPTQRMAHDHRVLHADRVGGLDHVARVGLRVVAIDVDAVAVAAQVDGQHLVGAGETIDERLPGKVALGDAVDQHQRGGRT